MRRLVWSGFIIFDHIARFASAMDAIATLYQQGKIISDEHISTGIEHALSAIAELYAGANQGKRLIMIG